MEQEATPAGLPTRCPPSTPERPDRLPVAVEDVGDDAPLGPLAPPRDRLPALEEDAQLGDQWEGAKAVKESFAGAFAISREEHARAETSVVAPLSW